MQEPMQKIALYSNGMAVFTRTIILDKNKSTTIDLPVKSEYLDEVLASLEVYGEVEIEKLPSYTPSASAVEKLDASNMQRDLMTKFSGQDVKISLNSGGKREGKLIGLQDRTAKSDGIAVQLFDVLVYKDGKVSICAAEDVENVEFPAERIKSEINKMLNVASQLACPDSKTVSMTLKGNGEAILQFTVPVAAWKMRYGLRITNEGCELNGQAIVDNNTDEDWKDASLTVVTGEPISFSTDLADVKVPKRSRFDLVKDQATGAMVAADEMMMSACCDAGPSNLESMGGARAMSFSAKRAAPNAAPVRAARPQADIREAGSFFQYTYEQTTTLPANQSAIIPLFTQPLNEAKKVLYFNANEDTKVFRAISLKNELPQDLGSGVCTVFEENTYLGKCIIKDTPKGQNSFLIYAVESNVDAKRDILPNRENMIAMHKSGKVFTTLMANVASSVYTFNNKKDQEFTVEIEHAHNPCKFEVLKKGFTLIETKNGHKIRFTLPKQSSLSFTVQETTDNTVSYEYDAESLVNWWSYHGSKISGKFQSKDIQELIKIKGRLADINNNAAEFQEKLKSITAEQKRLLSVLEGTKGHTDMAKWKEKLVMTESAIESAQAGINSSKLEAKKTITMLNDLFMKIEIEWKEEN